MTRFFNQSHWKVKQCKANAQISFRHIKIKNVPARLIKKVIFFFFVFQKGDEPRTRFARNVGDDNDDDDEEDEDEGKTKTRDHTITATLHNTS